MQISCIMRYVFFSSLHHKNLVQLRGVVLPSSHSNDPIYVILEFMTQGSMLEYLRSRGRAMVSSADLLDFAKSVIVALVYVIFLYVALVIAVQSRSLSCFMRDSICSVVI